MAWAVVIDDQITNQIGDDNPFTLGGIQYPSNWLRLATVAQRESLNIYPIIEGTRPDEQFYTVTGETLAYDGVNKVVNRTYQSTERTLAGLKLQIIARLRDIMVAMLAGTDWYVLRYVETTTAIPTAVANYRAAVRAREAELEAAVIGATDLAGLRAIATGEGWPTNS